MILWHKKSLTSMIPIYSTTVLYDSLQWKSQSLKVGLQYYYHLCLFFVLPSDITIGKHFKTRLAKFTKVYLYVSFQAKYSPKSHILKFAYLINSVHKMCVIENMSHSCHYNDILIYLWQNSLARVLTNFSKTECHDICSHHDTRLWEHLVIHSDLNP